MNAFDEYSSREELLRAAQESIGETIGPDGKRVFQLRDDNIDALRTKYENAVRELAQEKRMRAEAERRSQDFAAKHADETAELERLRAETAAPNELRETLRRYMAQSNESRAKLTALEAELQPLREENAAYKAKETRAAIEAQLVEQARKLNCCESAMRDVKRLASEFRLDAAGNAVGLDSRSVEETLRAELQFSPHWLNRSQGAEATGNGSGTNARNDRELFAKALRENDFIEALKHAPRERVDRF